MKKSFRRLGIVFIILLSILGVQAVIQKGSCANAATLGETLLEPEEGWQRYDDNNVNILYDNNWQYVENSPNVYGGAYHHNRNNNSNEVVVGATIKFEFYGTKLRILTWMSNGNSGANVKIDGVNCGNCSTYKEEHGGSNLFFEKQDLRNTLHKVEITTLDKEVISPKSLGNWFALDAIDIDKYGSIVEYNDNVIVSNLSLKKNEESLQIGEKDTLIANILPNNADNKNLIWSSSDSSIVSVDNEGNILALKEGIAKVTVRTTDGTNLSDSCKVTVSKKIEDRAVLTITMSNNAIKTYDLSKEELNAFLNWYDARSKGTAVAYYVFENKPSGGNTSNKDYIPYDRIEYFNIQEYKA